MTLSYRRSASSFAHPSPRRSTLLLGLTLACCSPLAGCGGNSGVTNAVGSTDTGNPPVVAEQKLRVDASGSGVVVSGASGAVPGGADVIVTNVTRDASDATTADDDGSFEVALAGSTTDAYRVDIEFEGRSASVDVPASSDPGPAASDPGPAVPSPADPTFADKEFLLQSAEGYTLVEGTSVSLRFEDGSMSFSAGCNGHFGDYSVCDGHLCASSLGSSEIGCDAERHAQDEWFASFFTSTPSFSYDNDTLTFEGDDATLEFLDRELANPDRSLTGRSWTVDTFITGSAASNLPLQEPPTVSFDDDGSFEAFTTCNTLEGSFVVSEQSLVLSNVSTTDVACSDTGSQNAEMHIAQVLSNGTVSFEIDAARLDLIRGELGLSATTD
jgi:heat shock protein HslJ